MTNIRWGFQKAIEIQSGVTTVEEAMKEQASSEPAQENPASNEGDNNAE